MTKPTQTSGRLMLVDGIKWAGVIERAKARASMMQRVAMDGDDDIARLRYVRGVQHTIEGDVAVIKIDAAMGHNPDWFEAMVFGTYAFTEVVAGLRRAAFDSRAKAVMVELDCPGSSVAGISEFTLAVRAIIAESGKNFGAFVNECATSGGYWLACLCGTIGGTRSSETGSIGVRASMYDYSELFKEEGVRPVLNDTGKFKSVGLPGRPITAEDEAYLMESVEDSFTQFIEVVSKARGLDGAAIRAMEAKIFTAPAAKAAGLIDVVTSRGEFLRMLGDKVAPNRMGGAQTRKAKAMNEQELRSAHGSVIETIERAAEARGAKKVTDAANAPATFAELDKAFGSEPGFVTECQRADRPMAAAHAAMAERLGTKLKDAQAKITALETEVAQLKSLPAKGKAEPVAPGPGGDKGAESTSAYADLVKVEMNKGVDRLTAEFNVQKAHPKVYAAHTAEFYKAVGPNKAD